MENINILDTVNVLKLVTEKKYFFIPSYQRGFRWTSQQVKDLLNDIDSFVPYMPIKKINYSLRLMIHPNRMNILYI